MPGPLVGFGGDRLMPLVQASVTPATWRGHGKAWAEWCALAHGRFHWEDRSFLFSLTVNYVLSLRRAGASASMAQRRLAGVGFFLKLYGLEDVTSFFCFRQALKGWRRECVRKDSRRPITYDILQKLVSGSFRFCSGEYEVVLFTVACCLAFFGALRVGELVSPTRSRPGGLLDGDVLLSAHSVRIRVRRSRINVLGNGEWLLLREVSGPICPVRTVAGFIPLRSSSPVCLAHSDGSPLSRCQFELLLKKGIHFIGLPPGDFGMHSFRIGAATEAVRADLWDPTVLLLGHSYIFWAAQQAEVRPGGSNLGFHHIQVIWRGVRGLRWSQVLPETVEFSRSNVGPVVIVIHAGGNDLCFVRVPELLAVMHSDLERIPGFFPEVVLVWSEIVPRLRWNGSRDPESAQRCHRSVNVRMSRFVRSRGGVVIRHRQLDGDNSRLLRPDGVHLNDIGQDIFLSGLQDGIEQALFLLSGGRHPV
ncbi:uncharacterized protein RB166_016958 [Leptodactylus fuscus]